MTHFPSYDKIICFIHSTNMNIHKTEILEKFILYLKERTIFQYFEKIIINNIGEAIDETYFKNISEKIVVINYSLDITLFECATIKQIITFAKLHDNYKILYLHTKGVSHEKTIYLKHIESWTNFMLYCLVDNGENCIKLLNKYDTVGCNFRKDDGVNKKHYSGNFWWATAAYIKKLKCMDFKEKYDAEFFILSQNPNYYNIYTLDKMYEIYYPLETYKNLVSTSFTRKLKNIYYCKLGWSGVGLCNQLYSLISCIFKCIQCNDFEKIIILDDFLIDINTNVYVSVDDIFNLESMNIYLKKYNIFLTSKHNIQLRFTSILYGIDSNKIDITNDIVKQYSNHNCLHVPVYTNLNKLYGDPVPCVLKQIYTSYKLNKCEYTIYEQFVENDEININFKDFSNVDWHMQNNITKERQENYPLINDLLVNIHFKEKYHTISNDFINSLNIQPEQAINIIHLRNEDDAISFWGNINQMPSDIYKTVLEDKYIYLIEKYIDKRSLNIILSMNTYNKVVDFMKIQQYKYVFCDKSLVNGREVNAIIDLLNGKHCNNIYIGNVNLFNYHGSTFSYVLYKLLETKLGIKKILIDLDNINVDEVIV